jgi:copper chaperone
MIRLTVDNIKCGGCANRIHHQLSAIEGVKSVDVNVEQRQVIVDADTALTDVIRQQLARLGYPEAGTTAGIAAVGADLRSVVSCAIGRVQGDKTK